MSNTATRLITLLMLLQRQPNQKASDLAENLGISVRSLHRYMAMLEDMGIPIYSERGPYGGFSLVRGYKMPPLVFTPEEAVAVYLGTSMVSEIWGRLYQEAARAALAKLDNVLPADQQQEIAWARRALIITGMHRPDLDALSSLLEQVRRAIREQHQVSIVYRSGSQAQPQSRRIDPYALVHRWGWWYLFGHCHLRSAIRCFRVDRIDKLTLLDKGFKMPAGFDIREYVAREFNSPTQVQMRMQFSPEGAHIAMANRSYWDTLEDQADGSVIVTMTSPDLQWAASTALAYGPTVTVLAPDELCRMIGLWSSAIAERYAKREENQPK
jgi:predicted DNA-binding transcriptional regulator YafY